MTTASYKMNEDGTFERIDGSDEPNTEADATPAPEPETKCSTCSKKSEPCISFFAYENSMMHKDLDNERQHKTSRIMCLTYIIITVIFVLAYTVRMNAFLDTINHMNAAIVELANAKGIIVP